MAAGDDWLSIEYREFYDFPRTFFVRTSDRWLFFDSTFDEAADDYGDFDVFDMGERGPADVASDWTTARDSAVTRLGQTRLSADSFDPTRRRAVARSAIAPFVV